VLKETIRVKTPEYAAQIIKATAMLHNFLIVQRQEEENDDDDFLDMD
jgi:hypothetical protein